MAKIASHTLCAIAKSFDHLFFVALRLNQLKNCNTMETKQLFLALCAFLVLSSCSEQETNLEVPLDGFSFAKQNWQQNTLSSSFFENQSKISHYTFSKKDLALSLSDPNLSNFRFVLGLEKDQIIIKLIGVNHLGEEISTVSSYANRSLDSYTASIESLENSGFQYSKAKLENPIVGKHLLSYSSSYDYISQWNEALQSRDIENLITDDGIRFKYYSLEKEVVLDMLSTDRVASIGLFLGLNAENKLTTVFLTKDSLDNLIVHPLNKNDVGEGGNAYDFTNPCPDACD